MAIYLDNAATTPLLPEVLEEHTKALEQTFGNASAVNSFGRAAKAKLMHARRKLAQSINANDDDIVITSGGTEGDNTAIIQTAMAKKSWGRHIITTQIEHEAVLKPMKFLQEHGFDVTYLPVDKAGQISLADLKNALRADTILVSIMLVNNEIGSIQPIKAAAKLVHEQSNAWFHTDAVQAYGALKIDVADLGVDMLSVSAHKINGPKFLGFLYRNQKVKFAPMLKGGDQEQKRRAGTENVPAIVAFAKASEFHSGQELIHQQRRLKEMKMRLLANLTNAGVDFAINGPQPDEAAPHIVNLWIKGYRADALLTNLDLAGLAVAAGSACTAGTLEPSHVLVALPEHNEQMILQSIRISFGIQNTLEEIDAASAILAKVILKKQQK